MPPPSPRGASVLLATLLASTLARSEPASAPAPIATVAIDLRGVADTDFRRLGLLALERKLALRLTQAGFALVAPDRGPELVLRLRPEAGDQLRLEIVAAGEASSRIVPRESADLETYQLEVIHKAVQAARLAEPRVTRQRASSRPRSAPTTAPVRPAPSLPQPGPAPPRVPAGDLWRAEIWGAALILYRPGGVDPLLRVGARLARRRGLFLGGALSVDGGRSGELTVVEWSGQVGGGWRFALPLDLALDLELLAGLAQHLYWLGGASPDQGSRVAFLGNLRLELGWSPRPWLRIGLYLLPGLADRGREHRLDGRPIWARSAFRLEAGLGLGFAIP